MEATLILAAIVLPLVVPTLVALVWARRRERHLRSFVSSQAESTMTLIGVRDRDLRESFAEALEYGGPVGGIPLDFLVTISPDGMTFWTFKRSPQKLFAFPAARVLDVAVGTLTERPEFRLPARARLALRIAPLDHSFAREAVIQFTVAEVHEAPDRLRFARDEALESIATRARGILGIGGPSTNS